MGGGPSSEQKQAAASQANLTNQLGATAATEQAFKEKQQNAVNPFYSNLMTNGPDYTNQALDFASGTNARAYAPARAALLKRLGPASGLPGYRDQALSDFENSRAQGYDSNLMSIQADRQAAKERGAAGLIGQAQVANPLGYYSAGLSGNQSIMQAPLQKPGFAGILGSLIGAGATLGAKAL
jgi:hypothetical protein